jgi:hypothetical protein
MKFFAIGIFPHALVFEEKRTFKCASDGLQNIKN